jgi:hypothetical protein
VRPLANLTATPLPGTEHAESPLISPDGKWVGFLAAIFDGRYAPQAWDNLRI